MNVFLIMDLLYLSLNILVESICQYPFSTWNSYSCHAFSFGVNHITNSHLGSFDPFTWLIPPTTSCARSLLIIGFFKCSLRSLKSRMTSYHKFNSLIYFSHTLISFIIIGKPSILKLTGSIFLIDHAFCSSPFTRVKQPLLSCKMIIYHTENWKKKTRKLKVRENRNFRG